MSKKKILIIDDEVDFCLLLKSFYTRKGYDVYMAHTLKDGLDCINEAKPDIIFLDNNLPDGLGWEAAPEIIDNNPTAELNLISAYQSHTPTLKNPYTVRILEKPLNLESLNSFY